MKLVPVSKCVLHTFSAISIRLTTRPAFSVRYTSRLYSLGESLMGCPQRLTSCHSRSMWRSASESSLGTSALATARRFSSTLTLTRSSLKSKGFTI